MKTSELIAFVGGGQMAGSLIGGLRAAGHPADRIRVAEPDPARARQLAQDHGVTVAARAAEIAAGADALVLAVKPQVMREAVAGLAPTPATTVISIAAGVRIASLRLWLGGSAPIVRTMPNTPALLRCGITALYADAEVPAEARARAERVLAAAGATCWVEREDLIDAVTALSGSGPAYYFLVTEALREAGAALGLDPATASLLATRTLAGAGRMAETGTDVATLRANVTSKGGTTEAAVAALVRGGLRQLFADALRAARTRAAELGAAPALPPR